MSRPERLPRYRQLPHWIFGRASGKQNLTRVLTLAPPCARMAPVSLSAAAANEAAMPQGTQPSFGIASARTGRGWSLLAFLVALAVLLAASYLLGSFWLANLTITEWRGAPAGSQLDIMFDEPAHPAWSW
jgi:hypothetical protein